MSKELQIEEGIYKITCEGGSARYRQGQHFVVLDTLIPRPPQFELWEIRRFKRGYSIQNLATGDYAGYDDDRFVWLSPEPAEWYIETSGGGYFHIKYPDRDLLWTSVMYPLYREFIFALLPADGTSRQQIQFIKIGDGLEDLNREGSGKKTK